MNQSYENKIILLSNKKLVNGEVIDYENVFNTSESINKEDSVRYRDDSPLIELKEENIKSSKVLEL